MNVRRLLWQNLHDHFDFNSDFTWQAALAANYRMKSADLVIGYRYMDFDLDNFGPIDDLNLGGPFLVVKFSF